MDNIFIPLEKSQSWYIMVSTKEEGQPTLYRAQSLKELAEISGMEMRTVVNILKGVTKRSQKRVAIKKVVI